MIERYVKETVTVYTHIEPDDLPPVKEKESMISLSSHNDLIHVLQQQLVDIQQCLTDSQQQLSTTTLQVTNLTTQYNSLLDSYQEKEKEYISVLSSLSHSQDEVKLFELKLKASNYEIENITKILHLTEEQKDQSEKRDHEYCQAIREEGEKIGEMRATIVERERENEELMNKMKVLKRKINAYKEMNCPVCGENFYESIVKLRVIYQQKQGEKDRRERIDNGERERVLVQRDNHEEDLEDMPRVGIKGLRTLRTQSAQGRERERSDSSDNQRSSLSPPRRDKKKVQSNKRVQSATSRRDSPSPNRRRQRETWTSGSRKRSPYR